MATNALAIVGLGNPGATYKFHRHNAGELAVRAIAARWSFPGFRPKRSFEMSSCIVGERKVFLVKSLTFMNDSGRAIGEFSNFHKLPSENFLIIHDELNLPLGTVRLKKDGGSGGHNGLRSIDSVLGNTYWRLRIGIGHPGTKDLVAPYVLSDFSSAELARLKPVFEATAEHLPSFIQGAPEEFIQRLLGAITPAPKKTASS